MERGSKRQELVRAAHQALLESGAAGLTLEAVLRAAGAGTGTFYHHFPGGRSQLVAEVYAEAHVQYEAEVLRVLQRNRDPEAGVKAVVHAHVRLFGAEPDLMRVLLHNRGAAAPDGTRPLQRAAQAWAGAAELPARPAPVLLALWLGPVLELGRLSPGALPAAAEALAQAAWAAVSSG